jgi:hypothetical protein
MTFQECELAILRHAVDDNEKAVGEKKANSEDVKKIIQVVEDFLIRKKRICYGGTAINNILPKYDQFYNRDIEIPDYDFFSDHALDDAKELADIYYAAGYTDVEAKSGVHHGTFKVFVNFIPVADITDLDETIYKAIQKDAISRAGIKYAPPNFLRMSMYLELSRPEGDISRWEKVLKRLNLLNKHYPLKSGIACDQIDFQRDLETGKSGPSSDQHERQKARRAYDKKGVDRKGKDVAHKVALSKGGSNKEGYTLQSPSKNRSFKRNSDKSMK